MAEYMILLPGDETTWESAPPQQREAVYAEHLEFARLLTQRGHEIAGGAELTHSREALVVRGALDAARVSQGPYTETVEQLTGYYLVRTEDLDDLLQVCGLLAGEGGLEVRRAVADSDPQGSTGGRS